MTQVPDAAQHTALETVVLRWVAACNARDLDAMRTVTGPDIWLRPVRLSGIRRSYQGHDGLGRWLADLWEHDHEHRLVIAETRTVSDGGVFAVGHLDLPGQQDAAPFWGLYRIAGARIVVARHALSDGDIPETLGWLP